METNTNHFQKCLRASLVEWRRGRKEALDSKKEVLSLEESHNKTFHTDRDHVLCAALGINKTSLNLSLKLWSRWLCSSWAAKYVWL